MDAGYAALQVGLWLVGMRAWQLNGTSWLVSVIRARRMEWLLLLLQSFHAGSLDWG